MMTVQTEPDTGGATLPYDISGKGGGFYCELSDFTDDFLSVLDERLGAQTDRFLARTMAAGTEKLRSRGEYLLEPLIAGVLLAEYQGYLKTTGRTAMTALSLLRRARELHPAVKRQCDAAKGKILTRILSHAPEDEVIDAEGFRLFTWWLASTGEFAEEAERLRCWADFLSNMPSQEQKAMLRSWTALASEFRRAAAGRLGRYTGGAARFISGVSVRNRNRENRLFCGRSETEYHLNMFAAEVLNREFRCEFSAAGKKIVLLPACMARPGIGRCMAEAQDGALSCTGCSRECTVNILTRALAPCHVGISIIPHSSGFSRFLRRWKGTGAGLIGVACVLNLLRGGYEMRRLGIPAQCVFLDYSGCAKHWHGRPTTLSAAQLFHVLGLGVYHE